LSVEIRDLSVTYLRHGKPTGDPVLRGINLKIKKGERFGILGPTGSGKTTLCYCLNGLIPREIPSIVEGEVIVKGVKTKDTPIEKITQNVGLVFSNPEFSVVEILVEDDIAFGPSNLNLSIEEINKRVKFAIEACRLKGYEKRSTGDLSGGETQAVAIAGILAMMTPIIVLDEPMTMLDPIGKETVANVLSNLSKNLGLTIIMTEAGNDIEYFTRFVDRIAVLYNGEILAVDTTQRIMSNIELMRKIGIEPPPVTTLFSDVVQPEKVPVKTEEAIALLKGLIKSRKLKLPSEKKILESQKVETTNKRKRVPIITVRNLHYVYPPDIRALKGINLDIYSGEKVAIIGQNGSGKTTLSYNLVGLLRPTNKDAKVNVAGLEVSNKKTPLHEIVKVINYAFQNPDAQLSQDTIWEEVTYGLKLMELPEKEIERRAMAALNLFGIADKKDEYILQASLDLKRYTTIASLVALEPKILILDEPTNGLDFEGAQVVMRAVEHLNKNGMTIIFITHNMELVAKYADRVIVMKDGNIYLEGTPKQVFTNPEKLKEAYLYPPQIARCFQALSTEGFPPDILTVEEARKFLREISLLSK